MWRPEARGERGGQCGHKVAEDAPEMLEKVRAGADSLLTQAKDALGQREGR